MVEEEPMWLKVQRQREKVSSIRSKATFAASPIFAFIVATGSALSHFERGFFSFLATLIFASVGSWTIWRRSEKGTFWSSLGFQLFTFCVPLSIVAIIVILMGE